MHRIDAESPLFGWDGATENAGDVQILVHMAGHHEAFQQEVHARWAYSAADIAWGMRFSDLFCKLPGGRRAIDYARFDMVEAEPASGPTTRTHPQTGHDRSGL
jgi:inward rectifier potassium channel